MADKKTEPHEKRDPANAPGKSVPKAEEAAEEKKDGKRPAAERPVIGPEDEPDTADFADAEPDFVEFRARKILGTAIRRHRTFWKLSQEELGQRLGITRATVSNWENGAGVPGNRISALISLFHVSSTVLRQNLPIPQVVLKLHQLTGGNFDEAYTAVQKAGGIKAAVAQLDQSGGESAPADPADADAPAPVISKHERKLLVMYRRLPRALRRLVWNVLEETAQAAEDMGLIED